MRRTETKEIEVTRKEQVVIKDMKICNKCGKEVSPTYSEDFISFYESFGYNSHFDGERWEWDVCPECLLEWIRTFKYVPDGFFQDEYCLLNSEQHQKAFEHWKKTDEWEDFKFMTYEEIVSYSENMNIEYVNEMIQKYHPNKPLLKEE